jgi:hypothetical protein
MFEAVDRVTPELQAGRALIVHAGETWAASVQSGKFDFFTKIAARAAEAGLRSHLVASARQASERLIAMGHHLNIVIGPRLPVGPRVWHAHPGYVFGFWYLDALGVNSHSSLGGRRFDPQSVDGPTARWFFNGVSGFNLRKNKSKFPQAERVEAPLPPARAVVYLQEIEHYQQPVHWIDTLTMLQVTAMAAGGGRVYVKLHPAQSPEMRAAVLALCAEVPNLCLSAASLHDLNAASEVVVTQNSAAGFEALLQKKPVISCAQCDYHHATLQAHTPDALAQAVAEAPARMAGFAYDRYLQWFLGQGLLEPGKPEFAERAWQILLSQG